MHQNNLVTIKDKHFGTINVPEWRIDLAMMQHLPDNLANLREKIAIEVDGRYIPDNEKWIHVDTVFHALVILAYCTA